VRRLVVLLAATFAVAAPAHAQERTQITYEGFTIATIPPTPNVTIDYKGEEYVTNDAGRVFIRAPRDLLSVDDRQVVKRNLTITEAEVEPGVRVRLARWYDQENRVFTAALDKFYRVQPSYSIQGRGTPVDADEVTSMWLKSRHGIRTETKGDDVLWLHGSRVVPTLGELENKNIQWTVESAEIRGQNVVNRSQQTFVPAKDPEMNVQLLFYRLEVSARDALFKIPIGSAVFLRYPNGDVERHEFEGGAKITFDALPRGSYKLKVDGPGYSFERPVSVSRNQVAELDVVSYYDIALAVIVLVGIAVGLVFAGRPELYRRLKRRLRRRKAAA
jgi:hypothetical protein